jgi:riboflavin synthase
MFTGIVEETGNVFALRETTHGVNLTIEADVVATDLAVGDSLAVNGCCLTVTGREELLVSFDLLAETLRRTNLGQLHEESEVNLERAMPANGRFGGHIVQGHVDCTAEVVSITKQGADDRLEIALPGEFARYVCHKGSVAIDGMSLTVAGVLEKSFVVYIIPHTMEVTNLRHRQPGELVNLECDLIAKYIERMLAARG